MQTKKWSFIEACINILIGYTVSIIAQYTIFPMFGVYIALSEHMLMGLCFTVFSVVRSYYVRRLFNYLHSKGIGNAR